MLVVSSFESVSYDLHLSLLLLCVHTFAEYIYGARDVIVYEKMIIALSCFFISHYVEDEGFEDTYSIEWIVDVFILSDVYNLLREECFDFSFEDRWLILVAEDVEVAICKNGDISAIENAVFERLFSRVEVLSDEPVGKYTEVHDEVIL